LHANPLFAVAGRSICRIAGMPLPWPAECAGLEISSRVIAGYVQTSWR
jgi:hypothetical protein